MSNISRRKFLKGAGVAALAVAAAGVLAGCSDQSTPDTGKKRPIKLKYMVTTQHESIVKDVPIEVPALADTVTFATIQANVPAELKDYEFNSTEDKKIIDGVVVIKMHKKAAAKPTVTIKYTTGTSDVISTDFKFYELEVDENATALTQEQLDSLPSENCAYRILKADEKFFGYSQGVIKDGVATVYVEAKN
ncbi:twin-arginine translocation signal domain-containing protein [uncultured Faecalibacterium sp.]|uniref:twin-arginine translocation signal domain-containing protein n=1 Tax=uncultured Faecalibacterium sp. TaxID=259315 RepID=UPI0026268E96|nr:twin-arginine translocation signal domain-containing protein [uncultured Faecalibacterium sp.]